MISTPRLDLKPWTEDLAKDFFHLTSDDGFNAFSIKVYRQKDIESARAWIKESVGKCAVSEKQTNEIIGLGGLTPWIWDGEELVDITYRLKQSAWGKGFGLEMAQGLLDYGSQQLKLTNITATITPDNHGSIKLAKKLGFKFDKKIVLLRVPTELYRLS